MFGTSDVIATPSRRYKLASQCPPGMAGNAGADVGADMARLVGLGPMTSVMTNLGPFPAQTLRKGDRLRTRDGRMLPITELRRLTLDEDFLAYHPGGQPVIIRQGALGQGLPKADLILAPGQKIETLHGHGRGETRRAADLIGRPMIMRKPERIITYTVIGLGTPAQISCNGVWVSLPG